MANRYHIINAEELGAQKWNRLTEENRIAFPYMQYEYISISAEDRWKILTDEERTFFLPLPFHRKLGFSQIYNPPFLQRSLALSTTGEMNISALVPALQYLTNTHNTISLNLDYDWTRLPSGFKKMNRRNYFHIYGQPVILNHHHQRNMRKAKVEHYSLDWQGEPKELMEGYYKHTLSRRKRQKKKLRKVSHGIVEWAHTMKVLRVALVKDRKGNAVAGVGLLLWKNRLINLLPFTTQEGWDGRAMYFLLLNLLKENPYEAEIFDFEGSEIPGVARFYKGFGPGKETYHGIHYRNQPWILKMLDTATNWFR